MAESQRDAGCLEDGLNRLVAIELRISLETMEWTIGRRVKISS